MQKGWEKPNLLLWDMRGPSFLVDVKRLKYLFGSICFAGDLKCIPEFSCVCTRYTRRLENDPFWGENVSCLFRWPHENRCGWEEGTCAVCSSALHLENTVKVCDFFSAASYLLRWVLMGCVTLSFCRLICRIRSVILLRSHPLYVRK